jgi:hypothetical protein
LWQLPCRTIFLDEYRFIFRARRFPKLIHDPEYLRNRPPRREKVTNIPAFRVGLDFPIKECGLFGHFHQWRKCTIPLTAI